MIALRAADPGDAEAIAAIYRGHVLGGIATFETDPPDPGEIARRMAAGGGRDPWLVSVEAGEVVGYAYAAPFHSRPAYRWTVETTVYLADAAQGRGIGRRLYGGLLGVLTAQGFAQAIARIALPNPASVALHESLGFRAAGATARVGWKLDRWIDVGLWQRSLADPADPPNEPQRWKGVIPIT